MITRKGFYKPFFCYICILLYLSNAMNLGSKIFSKKIFLFVFLAYILIASIFFYIYYSNVNIYGNLKIRVYQNNDNITSVCKCIGTRFSQYSENLDLRDSAFILHESLYLKKITVYLPVKAQDTKIIVTNNSGKELTYTSSIDGQIVTIDSVVSTYNKFDIIKIPYLNRFIFFLFLVFTTNFFAFVLLLNKVRFKSLIIVEVLATPFYIYLYHTIVLQKILVYTGVFLIFSVFTLIITIIWYLANKCISEKNKRYNLILIFSSFCFTLILVEIILRVFGIGKTRFEHTFGYYRSMYDQNEIVQDFSRPFQDEIVLETPEFCYKRKVNSIGLSDDEPVLNKHDNDFLIIGLGDSFTEGDGTHADSTWLKFLERKIVHKGVENWKFINAGICGSDPFYEYKLLKNKLLVYKPNLVIVAYGFDLNDVIFRGGMERFETNELALKRPFFLPAYSHSYIFRLIIHKVFKYDDYLMSPKTRREQTPRALSQLKESLVLFNQLAEENNFELLVVFYAQKDEIINEKYVFSAELIGFAESQQIECLNLLEYYLNFENMDSRNVEDYFWKYDGHHNAAGYEKFANGVFWKLEHLGYLDL